MTGNSGRWQKREERNHSAGVYKRCPIHGFSIRFLIFPLLCIFLLTMTPARARKSDAAVVRPGQSLKFEHVLNLGVEASRPIFQDNDGFLWFSSFAGGLFRYDGYELKNYPPRAGGLSHGTIGGIVEDPDDPDIFWIATWGGGLNRFDKAAEAFTVYAHNPNDPQSLADDYIMGMIRDRAEPDLLWITTNAGIMKFSRTRGVFTRYLPARTYSASLIQDAENPDILWTGLWPGGLGKFDKSAGKFTTIYTHDPVNPDSLGAENDVVPWVEQDRENPGILWVGTHKNGLDRFDKVAETFTHYPESAALMPQIWTLYDDGHGTLWLCGCDEPHGLVLFDKVSETFTSYRHAPGNSHSLGSDLVTDVYEDRAGTFWIGTLSGRIDKYDPQNQNIHLYQHNPDSRVSLSDNVVPVICEDRRGTIWLGTYNGLNRFDRPRGTFTRYCHDPDDPYSLPTLSVGSILEDAAGNFWIASTKGPLCLMDRRCRRCSFFFMIPRTR